MAAKEQISYETDATKPAAVKLSDNGDATKAMSPIFPTAKYAVSALAMPVKKTAAVSVKPTQKVATVQATKPAKRVVAQASKHGPMQLASFNQSEQAQAYGYASEPAPPRAAGIFGMFR